MHTRVHLTDYQRPELAWGLDRRRNAHRGLCRVAIGLVHPPGLQAHRQHSGLDCAATRGSLLSIQDEVSEIRHPVLPERDLICLGFLLGGIATSPVMSRFRGPRGGGSIRLLELPMEPVQQGIDLDHLLPGGPGLRILPGELLQEWLRAKSRKMLALDRLVKLAPCELPATGLTPQDLVAPVLVLDRPTAMRTPCSPKDRFSRPEDAPDPRQERDAYVIDEFFIFSVTFAISGARYECPTEWHCQEFLLPFLRFHSQMMTSHQCISHDLQG